MSVERVGDLVGVGLDLVGELVDDVLCLAPAFDVGLAETLEVVGELLVRVLDVVDGGLEVLLRRSALQALGDRLERRSTP